MHSVLTWWLHFNHCSPEGRRYRIHPCGDGEELFLVDLNHKPILHARLNTFKPKKKQMWEVTFINGNFNKPDFIYKPEDRDQIFHDLIAGKFDPLDATPANGQPLN